MTTPNGRLPSGNSAAGWHGTQTAPACFGADRGGKWVYGAGLLKSGSIPDHARRCSAAPAGRWRRSERPGASSKGRFPRPGLWGRRPVPGEHHQPDRQREEDHRQNPEVQHDLASFPGSKEGYTASRPSSGSPAGGVWRRWNPDARFLSLLYRKEAEMST